MFEPVNGHDSGSEFQLDHQIAPQSPPSAPTSAPTSPPAPAAQGGAPAPAASAPQQAPPSAAANPALRAGPSSAAPASGGAMPGQQAAPVSSPVRDALRARGLQADVFQDDEAAINYLFAQAQRNRELEYWAQMGQRYAAQSQQPQGQPAQQAAGGGQQAAEPSWKKLWNRPEIKSEWMNQVVFDRDLGQYVPRPNYFVPPNVVQAINEHHNWKREAVDKLLDNPFDLVWQGTQDKREAELAEFEQRILDRVGQIFSNQDSDKFVVETVNQHSHWMHARDANGQLIFDLNPQTGQYFPRPSEHGWRYIQAVQKLKGAGITDPKTQHEFALNMIGGAPQAGAAAGGGQPTAPALSPAEQRRENFLQRARAPGAATLGPSPTGTATNWNDPASPPQNPRLDFSAMLDATMQERGMVPATG